MNDERFCDGCGMDQPESAFDPGSVRCRGCKAAVAAVYRWPRELGDTPGDQP